MDVIKSGAIFTKIINLLYWGFYVTVKANQHRLNYRAGGQTDTALLRKLRFLTKKRGVS
jgi:hypothetical protein